MRRYLACPVLACLSRGLRRKPPPWAGTGDLRVALNLVPHDRLATILSAAWLCVAYRTHLAARHQGGILRPRQAEGALCTTLRSLSSRSGVARAAIAGEPLEERRRRARSPD